MRVVNVRFLIKNTFNSKFVTKKISQYRSLIVQFKYISFASCHVRHRPYLTEIIDAVA